MITSPRPAADSRTWERRRRAAWIDYLRTTRACSTDDYRTVEQQAWRQLERRLRRNDELAGRTDR